MSDQSTTQVDQNQALGVAVCVNCQKRYRIYKKHEAMVGKSVKCPACHQPFVVKLDVPSQLEQAAIENADKKETTEAKKKINRRSKSEIRLQFLDRIRN